MLNYAVKSLMSKYAVMSLRIMTLLNDSDVKNFSYTTPEYQPLSVLEDFNSLLATLKKKEEIQELFS